MNASNWNASPVWRAVKELLPQMVADESEPQISDVAISDDDRALAYYLARSFIRISAMVQDEIAYDRLINQA